jgi:hypothetical protein
MSIQLSRDERAQAMETIRTHFLEERDEDLGDLAALKRRAR